MDIIHFVLAPFLLLFPIILVLYYRTYYISSRTDKYFFVWGFILKIFGATSAVLIYTQYYKGGDTTYYQQTGAVLADYVREYPSKFFRLLFNSHLKDYTDFEFIPYRATGIIYLNEKFSYTISKISMLVNLITFNSFFYTSIICSYFSFFASWNFYKFIVDKIQYYKKPVGYAIFFMPSVIFWGSGLFKDTFSLIGLYLILIGAVNIFGYKKYTLANLIFMIVGYYLLVNIRSFFLIIALPCILVWIFSIRYYSIKNKTLKLLFVPVFIITASVGGYLVIGQLTESIQELSLENLKDRSKGFQDWHSTLKGSAYTIDISDYSTASIIQKMPEAINVTLFRPYLWEVNKPIVFLSAIQSFILLIITLYLLLRMRIIYFFINLFKSPEAITLLGFSLFYAFITGFTSFNFGALDRYKIPCLSPYVLSLIFVLDTYRKSISKPNVA